MKNESLNKLLEMKKRLNRHASNLGLSYRCDFNFLNFEGDFCHLNIESKNTNKLSYRISDSRFIREGADMYGAGLSIPSMYRRVLRELRSHAKCISLNKEARETNCIVFQGQLVAVENDSIDSMHVTNCIYRLINADGSSSTWYGHYAEDAIRNASPWLKEIPVLIQLESDGLNTMGA